MSKKLIWAILLSFGAFSGCDSDESDVKKALLVQPGAALNLVENGASQDFVIKLNSEPAAPVTVNITTTMDGVVEFSDNSVVIRPDGWTLGNSVRVSCTNDDLAKNREVMVVFTAHSVDSAFANLTETRLVTCLDDDAGKVVEPPVDNPPAVDPDVPQKPTDPKEPEEPTDPKDPREPDFIWGSILVTGGVNLVTTEDGGKATFKVSLGKKPSSDVFVFVHSEDETEGIAEPSILTFTSTNWDVAQTVTLTGVDDDVIDGTTEYLITLTATSSDPAYDDMDDVIVKAKNIDNETMIRIVDEPGVYVSPVAGLKTTEKGGTATFNVALESMPSRNVVIPVASSDITEGIVNVSNLTFTPFNWSDEQTVTITGVGDDEHDGDVAYTIKLGPAESEDMNYANMEVTDVRVTNIDDDPPDIPVSIEVSKTTLEIEESGAPGTFKVTLGEAPIADVLIAVSVTDASEGVVSPSLLTFTPKNWKTPQTVMVSGVVDGIEDGTQIFNVEFAVTSEDSRYEGYSVAPVRVTSADSDIHTGTDVKLRIMAANISSGNYQAYSPGHGVRIFQAVKPDIVLIQEFNWEATSDTNAVAQQLVTTAFGDDYTYYRGKGAIPNGIISRYPILSSGAWESNKISNRQWDWAVVDLPGPKELLLVSVHLSTDKNAQEMPVLMEKIQEKIDTDAMGGAQYFVMIGGDFNTSSRNTVVNMMSSIFTTSEPYPMDQEGNTNTNLNRNSPYDYLLCSPDWCEHEVPVEIGTHTGLNAYKHGHIFDSRVYGKTKVGNGTELDYVSPVLRDDSGAENMQHMAVIRDFSYSY